MPNRALTLKEQFQKSLGLPFQQLLGEEEIVRTLEEEVAPEDGWCGRRVVVWEGTTISTADTPSNQKEYPQHTNQAQGCGFALLKLVVMFSLATGADGVFRQHQSRKSDFRQGKKLGIGDHIVTWDKPKCCPSGVSPETWSALPEQLQVREVHLLIRRPGFRPKKIVVVTTLLDASVYTHKKLAQLYLYRGVSTIASAIIAGGTTGKV